MNRMDANAEKTNLSAVEEVAELQRHALLDVHSLCQNLANTPALPILEAGSAVPNLRRIRTIITISFETYIGKCTQAHVLRGPPSHSGSLFETSELNLIYTTNESKMRTIG